MWGFLGVLLGVVFVLVGVVVGCVSCRWCGFTLMVLQWLVDGSSCETFDSYVTFK